MRQCGSLLAGYVRKCCTPAILTEFGTAPRCCALSVVVGGFEGGSGRLSCGTFVNRWMFQLSSGLRHPGLDVVGCGLKLTLRHVFLSSLRCPYPVRQYAVSKCLGTLDLGIWAVGEVM